MGKKWRVRFREKALEDVPVDERARVAAEIERAFEDFDPANPPGEPVVPLAPGTRACPRCGGELVEFAVIPGRDSSRWRVLDCEKCDASFSEPVEDAQ